MSAPARRGSRLLGLALAVLLATATALFSSGVASAHAYLRGSDPAEGATVQTLPATVTLDFNETIQNFEPVVVVTGPDGKNYATGAIAVLGNEVSTAVSTDAPAGAWSMAYRVVSADGHPVTGEVKFTVAATVSSPPSPSSAPVPSTRASSSVPPTSTRTSATASSTRSTAGSTAAGSSTAGSSAAPSTTGASDTTGSAAGSSSPAPPVAASTPVAGTSSGTDWWIWVAIAVAAVILAVAGFITLRKPRED